MNWRDWTLLAFGCSGWIVVLIQRLSNRQSSIVPQKEYRTVSAPGSTVSSRSLSSGEVNQIHVRAVRATSGNIFAIEGKARGRYAALFLIVICVLAAIALVWNAKHAVKLPINITSSLNVAFIQTIESKSLPEVPRWKATAIRTTDSFGNDIEVIVGVLWDPYRWVKGNAELVAIDEAEKHRYSIEDVIRSFQNNEHRPIIAIGLASHENVRENPDQENERAGDRADRLVELCGRHFISKPHIYSLNFGAYSPNGNPSRFSASERRVVLVVINQGENSPELMQRLKPALLQAWQQGSLMFNPKDYLLFDTPEFQLKKRQNF